MLRWITAGESHGRALVAVVEGMVAGVHVTSADIADQLARRRLGYGRGARMTFERDAVTVLSGIRHGSTLGGPIAIEIGNTEWPKWETVMAAEADMIAQIEAAKKDGDTLGGVVEAVALGLPVGLGSFTSGDHRLDSQLAAAVMGIQAIKGVEIGDGFQTARRRGSRAHDEMYPGPDGVVRSTNRAGGLEGGMTNGQPLRVRAAMKPISTVPRALATVDLATGDEAVAIHQRSDVCAVPAAGVVVETMVALVLARAALEKFGGDSLAETQRNIAAYQRSVADREAPAARVSG